VDPLPVLKISPSDQGVTLSWPLWATNFVLQTPEDAFASPVIWTNLSVTAGVSNNENVVTLPLSDELKLYRLFQP
jgi:hypothetical protein